MKWFIRYNHPYKTKPQNLTIEAASKPEAISKVKYVIDPFIYNKIDFYIIDCVQLKDE